MWIPCIRGGAHHINYNPLRGCTLSPLAQGYGLTETCAATFIAEPYKWDTIGTVGAPLPGVQLRLEAVPEMGYLPTAAEPAGEVCLRGPSIFKGYYKQLELTEEVLGEQGLGRGVNQGFGRWVLAGIWRGGVAGVGRGGADAGGSWLSWV